MQDAVYLPLVFSLLRGKMKLVLLLILIAAATLLSGCTTLIKGNFISKPDLTYTFDRSAPVVVTVAPKATNPQQSKNYITRVVSALKSNGFSEVYTENDRSQASAPIKMVFFVAVENKTAPYSHIEPQYGTVGSTTTCNGNMGCTTTPSYGLIGYLPKLDYMKVHDFALFALDAQSKQNVLSVAATSFNSDCTDNNLYDFPSFQALSRMNLNQIVKQDFSVKMPEGYRCK
jgi:hypothetical protein